MMHKLRAQRPAATSGVLLVPVWGSGHIHQFLEFGLPMLLAPGNLPAVAEALPFRVIALSDEEGEVQLRSHPAWQHLQSVCAADVQPIDDLITDGNHSATLTLALERAIRSFGETLVDTCFILWMSDYLIADGSLVAVMQCFRDGASGVFAGNFQMVAESALPQLRQIVDPVSPSICVSKRELVAWSLSHLHPATSANIVNSGLIHNSHVNRLFWRVDEKTLIGRFYLMHPIGVRPETADFKIGASFDYSFIPEMCPSGNIRTLTRSDDCFIVELQRRDYENEMLLPGPMVAQELADDLSGWTTAQHRKNIEQILVFQAGEAPAHLPDVISKADEFVESVGKLLTSEPRPHRDHHYWTGSIAVNRVHTGRATRADWPIFIDVSSSENGLERLLLRSYRGIFGSLPKVTRFHPRWPDCRLLCGAVERAIADGQRVLFVTDQSVRFAQWLSSTADDVTVWEAARLLGSTPALFDKLYPSLLASFDACIISLPKRLLGRAAELIERVSFLLKSSGRISMIIGLNDEPMHISRDFVGEFAAVSRLGSSAWTMEIQYVPADRARWIFSRVLPQLDAPGSGSHLLSRLSFRGAILMVPLAIITYLSNLRTSARPPKRRTTCSSVFLTLRRSDRETGVAAPHTAAPVRDDIADRVEVR
jgi:hypothetical protein